MIRNLKTLGLALGALFAFGVLFASGAAAAPALTSTGPVTLTGTETASADAWANSLTLGENKIKCPGSTYGGHKVGTSELLPSGSTEATVTPKYVNCVDGGGHFVTVDQNSCDYVFHAIEATATGGTYKVKTDIVCPAENTITVTVFNDSAHTEKLCTITIEDNQTNLTGLHLTNTAEDIDLTGTIEGIKAITHGLCVLGFTPTDSNGIMHVDVTIKGDNSLGSNTAVSVSG